MSPAKLFTDQQPKDGDTIMHCGHLECGGPMHWFKHDRPVQFERPDRTRGEATWFAACEACLAKHGEKVTKFVRGDGRWTGDAPIIKKTELA